MSATLICLGSSSSGNNYILDADGEQLILECGVPVAECLKALKYDISSVSGAVATHGHRDHAAHISQYVKRGISVYSNEDVASKFEGVTAMRPKRKYSIGNFTVIGLNVPHGDTPCFSFLIEHPNIGRLAFITDAKCFPYDFLGCDTLICEANYSEEIRSEAVLAGSQLRAQSSNHMELSETIRTIRRLGRPRTILCHLSSGLSDKAMFRNRIYEELLVKAEMAEKGSVHDISPDF